MDRVTRLAPSDSTADATTETNTFRFTFSNEQVGRDGHVVKNSGIQYSNYARNNVVLWCHDDSQPTIGSGTNIDTSGPNCRIDITFADRATLPFAGTIRDLVAGKWLRAVSMSWQPLSWKYSTDSSRPGGIDFTEVDLLEVSVVPLPALPSALADARSRGINTRPLARWAERALDTQACSTIPRAEIEALYRAARPRTDSRAGRLAIVREIQEREDRRRVADAIAARVRAADAIEQASAEGIELDYS